MLARDFEHSIVPTVPLVILVVVRQYVVPGLIPSQPAAVAPARSSDAAHPPPAPAR